MLKNLDEAILNTTKGRINKYGDAAKNSILYTVWPKNYAETMNEFYVDFIEPRLPDPEVVRNWHNVIKDYASRKGRIYPVRAGNQKTKLRRGWLVDVNEEYSYMFTDNDLAVYIYKMALDGFCPTPDEFFAYMTVFKDASDIGWLESKHTKRKTTTVVNQFDEAEGKHRRFLSMPVHFNKAGGSGFDKTETMKNAYINTGPAPACCLGKYNYKHSHIVDIADKEYEIPGMATFNWKEKKNAMIGQNEDYQWDDMKRNYVWKRKMTAVEEAELDRILRAHLFRFLDPMNHFLAPMKEQNKYTKKGGIPSADIAEYENLQKYLIQQKQAVFKTDFEEFLSETCAPSELVKMEWHIDGGEEIRVCYHEKSFDKSAYGIKEKAVKTPCPTPPPYKKTADTKTGTKKTASAKGRSGKRSYDEKLELAAYYMRNDISLIDLEKVKMSCNANGTPAKSYSGSRAKAILNALGVTTAEPGGQKGLLIRSDIATEIDKATGEFKKTLEEIQKRGLYREK